MICQSIKRFENQSQYLKFDFQVSTCQSNFYHRVIHFQRSVSRFKFTSHLHVLSKWLIYHFTILTRALLCIRVLERSYWEQLGIGLYFWRQILTWKWQKIMCAFLQSSWFALCDWTKYLCRLQIYLEVKSQNQELG